MNLLLIFPAILVIGWVAISIFIDEHIDHLQWVKHHKITVSATEWCAAVIKKMKLLRWVTHILFLVIIVSFFYALGVINDKAL